MAEQQNKKSNSTSTNTTPADVTPASSGPTDAGPAGGSAVGESAVGESAAGAHSAGAHSAETGSSDGLANGRVAAGGVGGAEATTAAGDTSRRYLRPTKSTNVFNNMVAFITRCGISILGSRVLYVRGRKTGEWRSVPVNLLTLDGQRYLVSPRGHSQWVRNLRATGHGELRVGRRVERFVPTELGDDDKPVILRAYLRRWKFEVGMFFEGVDAKASDEVLRGIAPGYPVFRITTAP